MHGATLITVALITLGFGLFSRRLERTVITAPMAFVALGLLVGPSVLGVFEVQHDGEFVLSLAEITLVILLFTDASQINLSRLRRDHLIPQRLLLLGLPLTIALGAGIAALVFPELGFWQAAVIAAILAPTDAALGQAVVSSPDVPERLRVGLEVESGLNDGIALPIILIFTCVAAQHETTTGYWILFVGKQLTLGPLAGIVVGVFGARLVDLGTRTGWMSESFQRLSAIAMALLAYAVAEEIGGNGFIAAFVGGIAFGNAGKKVAHCLYEFAEAEAQLLTLITFLIFGAFMIIPNLDHVTPMVVVYALLSLTVIRMLPVALALRGLGLAAGDVAFLGWFGPRGVASFLFALLVLGKYDLANMPTIMATVTVTVSLSVLLHGLTAYPWAHSYKGSDKS